MDKPKHSVFREAFLAKRFELWPNMEFSVALLLSNEPWQAGVDAIEKNSE